MQIHNYEILHVVGKGGMATVYLAKDEKFHANVAVKVLNKEFVHNENVRKRFLAEARNMYRMSHSNIIKVTDLIDAGDTVAFVMEYVEGNTLKDYISVKGALHNEEIYRIFYQMLDAVGYVHEKGFIHRDIKPSNFILDKKGKVKLLDFGIAKNTDASSSEYTMTGTAQQMGTPLYMSPEQVKATKDVTSQSDIYSLGVVLWQMVTGKKPYADETLSTFEIQTKIVNDNLPITGTIWDNVIQKSTSKVPSLRFNQIADFIEVLGKNDKPHLPNMEFDKTVVASDNETTRIETINPAKTLSYSSVQIGGQIWMTENLTVDRFRNGDYIAEAKTNEEWIRAAKEEKPAWCYYNNDPLNGKKYGKLYNWYAVNDPRGLAPVGWHVPSDAEWTKFIDRLGGASVAGKRIKTNYDWFKNGNGTDAYKFSGLPGGYRHYSGQYEYLNHLGFWWCSDEATPEGAWLRELSYVKNSVDRYRSNKRNALSVRCVKNTQ